MIEVPWSVQHGVTSWLKSVLLFCAALAIISVFTFILIYLTPGDPAFTYLRALGIPYSPEALAAAREQLGLNKSIFEQYFIWLNNILHGNLGTSYMLKQPVSHLMREAVGNTLILGGVSIVFLSILSFSLAFISVYKENLCGDIIVKILSFICVSLPNFLFGYILILIFALKLRMFPISGISGNFSFVLPSFTLILPLLGNTTLFLRKIFLEHLHEEHSQNALLRGVKFPYIVKNHVVRNALPAIITIFSNNILNLITGSIIVETVFSWPGIGTLFVKAVQQGDAPIIQSSVLLFGILALITNAITQNLVHWLNPRHRHQKRGSHEI